MWHGVTHSHRILYESMQAQQSTLHSDETHCATHKILSNRHNAIQHDDRQKIMINDLKRVPLCTLQSAVVNHSMNAATRGHPSAAAAVCTSTTAVATGNPAASIGYFPAVSSVIPQNTEIRKSWIIGSARKHVRERPAFSAFSGRARQCSIRGILILYVCSLVHWWCGCVGAWA